MKMQKSNIAYNLTTLRQLNKFSQEEVAERIGVSRQAVAKWEAGQSVPDILNCDALAKLYDVELDDLIHYDQGQTGESIPPKGKHIFGSHPPTAVNTIWITFQNSFMLFTSSWFCV